MVNEERIRAKMSEHGFTWNTVARKTDHFMNHLTAILGKRTGLAEIDQNETLGNSWPIRL
jgi:hypothetical protein